MDNIFQIQTPNQYTCQIWYYQAGMSQLILAVRNSVTGNCHYIIFDDILYVSAPTLWAGANFITREQSECDRTLHYLGYDKYMKKYYKLFEVAINDKSLRKTNKIIALFYTVYTYLFRQRKSVSIIARNGVIVDESQYKSSSSSRR